MMKRKRRGRRPCVDRDQIRSERVEIRVTPGEKKLLESLAKYEGLSVGRYLMRKVMCVA